MALKAQHRRVTQERHEEQLRLFTESIDTILWGDSVFERFIWFAQKDFGPNVLILAKGGDKIEHLMWRAQHTEGSTSIKNLVLHIGTNNLGGRQSVDTIAGGILGAAETLHAKFPQARITLIPLYQRQDVDPSVVHSLNDKLREGINSEYTTLRSDFWDGLLPSDRYEKKFYEDNVHLTKRSYEWFYEQMTALLNEVRV